MLKTIDKKGGSRLSSLIYLLVATMLIYLALKFVPAYMDYYAMDDEVAQQLHISLINPPDVIRNDLLLKAKELELPIQIDDITMIYDNSGNLTIRLDWYTRVDLGYGVTKLLHFEIDSTREATR